MSFVLEVFKLKKEKIFINIRKINSKKVLSNPFIKKYAVVEKIFEEEFPSFDAAYAKEISYLFGAFKKHGFSNVRSTSFDFINPIVCLRAYNKLIVKFPYLNALPADKNSFSFKSKGNETTQPKKRKQSVIHEVCYIYVLLLADRNFYVGWTKNIKNRFKTHLSGLSGASVWTKQHKPIKIFDLYFIKDCTEKEALKYEDFIAEQIIDRFGYDRVRGGKYTASAEINKKIREDKKQRKRLSTLDLDLLTRMSDEDISSLEG